MQIVENQDFLGKYTIKEEVGSGSFGKVFRIQRTGTSKNYALKVDIKQKGNAVLEAKILSDLQGIPGIPKLYKSGITDDFSYMILELLGCNLSKMLKTCSGKFSLSTVLLATKQILQRIEHVHQKGYLHRDLKPQQILLSKSRKTLFLTDFGLSRKYITNSYHISYQGSCPHIGNATFSSLNNHSGARQSRRDDLESIAYFPFYLLKGSLPWHCGRKQPSGLKWQSIYQQKSSCKIETLCEGCPAEFGVFLSYARSLKFEEKPDYEYCAGLFDQVAVREGLGVKGFEWTGADTSESFKVNLTELSGSVRIELEDLRVHARRKSGKGREKTRAKTVLGRGRRLPEREGVLKVLRVNDFFIDESTYNSLEITPKNIWPEIRDRKHLCV